MQILDLDYTVVHRPDGHVIDGIHGLADAPSSSWIIYFEVEDTDAVVRRALDTGGTCPGEPSDSPYGRIAVVRDPFGVGSSVVEDRQVELAEAAGVGEYVDCKDLPACNREAEYDTWSSARGPHGSGYAVDECRLCEPGTPR